MKSLTFEPQLVAPCGMNCAVCSGYLAFAHDIKKEGIRMPYCAGCRPRDKKCAFLKKKCGTLLKKKVKYCFECEDFPCKNLEHIDRRYRELFRMSLINNLRSIKKNGILKFLELQEKEWLCPKCGDVICCHNGICYGCGLCTLKKKKEKYRW